MRLLALAFAGAAAAGGVPAEAHAQTSTSFGVEADARVVESSPSSNYGGSSLLRVDGGSDPDVESYLRVTVAGLSGSVESAKLRVRTTSGTVDGPATYAADDGWSEAGITWNNRPARTEGPSDDAAGVPSGAWLELDVTRLVTGNGTYSFVLAPTSNDALDMASRNATSDRPVLVVTTVASGPPTWTAPPTISGTAGEGQTVTAQEGTVTGTQPVSFEYQWQRCDASGGACVDLLDARGKTYALTSSDVGSTIGVRVTATNAEGSSTASAAPTAVVTTAPPPGDPVIAAAGDIAGCGYEDDEATAKILDTLDPTKVLTLGDNVYEVGSDSEFAECYEPTWGRHKARTSPAVGNHEYKTAGASGYFNYFGEAAGDRSQGYYAFDLGAWRIYALNSNCEQVACATGSPQEQWFRSDLIANPRSCVLAYTHHPRFSSHSSAERRDNDDVAALYEAFYEASGDVWLAAHNHYYERLARLDPNGALDPFGGVRTFVVGTGGNGLYPFGTPISGSEVRNNSTHGVLSLRLHETSYEWEFLPEAGKTFTDAGTDTCQGSLGDRMPPTAPGQLSASAPTETQVDLTWTASTDDVGVAAYEVYRDGALLAETAGTTYSDTTVNAGTTYAYHVKARDPAGNVSAPSNTATVTPGIGTRLVFAPEADARVQEANPTTNYGRSYLRTDGGSDPDTESVLRFTVAGGSGAVASAKLRVYAYSSTSDGPAVSGATSEWAESSVTWATRPATTSGPRDDKGPIAEKTWVEYDVTPLVTGNGTYTFRLATASTDGVYMYSREASTATLRPELVVTFG